MDTEATPDAPDLSTELTLGGELRGSVLDVVGALRAENDWDAVLEIVRQLVADNSEMTRRLARIAVRFKKSERVGKAQLVLFLDALRRGEGEPEVAGDEGPDEIDEADAKLRGASGMPRSPTRISPRSRRASHRVSRRRARQRRRTCPASTTRSWCRPSSVRARSAARSACALATTSPS